MGGKRSTHDTKTARHLVPEKAQEAAYFAKKFGMTQEEALRIINDAGERFAKGTILPKRKK